MRKPRQVSIVEVLEATRDTEKEKAHQWSLMETRTQVGAVLPTPDQLAATCAQMAKQAAAAAAVQTVGCEVLVQDTGPDTDSDLGTCMIHEVNDEWRMVVTPIAKNMLYLFLPFRDAVVHPCLAHT